LPDQVTDAIFPAVIYLSSDAFSPRPFITTISAHVHPHIDDLQNYVHTPLFWTLGRRTSGTHYSLVMGYSLKNVEEKKNQPKIIS